MLSDVRGLLFVGCVLLSCVVSCSSFAVSCVLCVVCVRVTYVVYCCCSVWLFVACCVLVVV